MDTNILIRPFYMYKDYELITGWLEKHNREPIPAVLLPPCNAVAYREDNGKNIAVGFLYQASASGIAFIDHIISNPDNTKKESYIGVNRVIKCLTKIFQSSPYYVLYTVAPKHSGLDKLMSKYALSSTEEMNQYVIATN